MDRLNCTIHEALKQLCRNVASSDFIMSISVRCYGIFMYVTLVIKAR